MLDPTLNAYALAVAGASGAVAAGMHATSLAATGKPWPPRRVFVAELILTAVVGVAVCELFRQLPWKVELLPLLVIAAMTGAYLGPRGIAFFFLGGWATLKKAMPWLSNVPDPPAPPAVEPPEVKPPELTVSKEAKDV